MNPYEMVEKPDKLKHATEHLNNEIYDLIATKDGHGVKKKINNQTYATIRALNEFILKAWMPYLDASGQQTAQWSIANLRKP